MPEQEAPFRIRISNNGPYIVVGGPGLVRRQPAESVHGEPLEWEPAGDPIEPEDPQRFALCRCGHSSNKPFCDGTHFEVGFDGTLTADRRPRAERQQKLTGDGIVMTDDTTLCADYGFCGTRFTNVWEMTGESSDPEVRERLQRMVALCPSGRLEWSFSEGGEAVEPEFAPSVAVIPNGPYWVRGGPALEDREGFAYERRNRMTLCRCGESQNKPFCDGAHKSSGFRAD